MAKPKGRSSVKSTVQDCGRREGRDTDFPMRNRLLELQLERQWQLEFFKELYTIMTVILPKSPLQEHVLIHRSDTICHIGESEPGTWYALDTFLQAVQEQAT